MFITCTTVAVGVNNGHVDCRVLLSTWVLDIKTNHVTVHARYVI